MFHHLPREKSKSSFFTHLLVTYVHPEKIFMSEAKKYECGIFSFCQGWMELNE
jgi:hypothetical protein